MVGGASSVGIASSLDVAQRGTATVAFVLAEGGAVFTEGGQFRADRGFDDGADGLEGG